MVVVPVLIVPARVVTPIAEADIEVFIGWHHIHDWAHGLLHDHGRAGLRDIGGRAFAATSVEGAACEQAQGHEGNEEAGHEGCPLSGQGHKQPLLRCQHSEYTQGKSGMPEIKAFDKSMGSTGLSLMTVARPLAS
jgi:hypothetical protein